MSSAVRFPSDPSETHPSRTRCAAWSVLIPPIRRVVPILAILPILMNLGAPPAKANVLPESAILIHVQHVGTPCSTTIQSCTEIIRTTEEGGMLEFQIFVYPLAYEEHHYPISSLTTDLTWPQGWQLVSWETCGGGSGTLLPYGLSYRLNITWAQCPPISGQLFLAADFVMNVSGPGRLGFANVYENPIWLRCPPDAFMASATGCSAEAGMDCEFTRVLCGYPQYCEPKFDETILDLVATEGGTDQGELPFTAMSATGTPCPLTVDSGAPWAQGSIVHDTEPNCHLVVVGDATGLTEGEYHTWVRVSHYSLEGRCVQVNFTVEGNSDVPDPPAACVKTWGGIKGDYR